MVSLRIWVDEAHYHKIEGILGIKPKPIDDDLFTWWIHETEDTDVYFIDYFLSILEGKYEQLKQIGIERNDISVWVIYYYDGQCNMEFSPERMYKLGKEEITLCISCSDIHDYEADEYDEDGKLIVKE
jgi:hypothetical protein